MCEVVNLCFVRISGFDGGEIGMRLDPNVGRLYNIRCWLTNILLNVASAIRNESLCLCRDFFCILTGI